jgi:hypothetical protein
LIRDHLGPFRGSRFQQDVLSQRKKTEKDSALLAGKPNQNKSFDDFLDWMISGLDETR